ncbi:hypothetical protein AB0D10_39765 [Kitasatospora sp. NPDC048545]|uniref:hypothetical protein n=1 Tax=Kitasatospora sp. NPDC048545 TaxID=3157208 RepID=UPI0033E32A4F
MTLTTTPTTTAPALPGPAVDPAPVGDESTEWALWLTGTGEQRPMRDHITALLTAAQHTAQAALHDTGSLGAPVDRAVVLHRGRVWSPEPHAASGAVQPVLLWSARCKVCGEPFDEEYGHHSTVGEAVEQAVDGEWTDTGGGWLICGSDDRDHEAARDSRPAPAAPITGQNPLPGIPADGPVHSWFGLTYANYLVVPRTLLQSMPASWQQRTVACLTELDQAFAHVARAEAYDVVPGTVREVGELTDAQLAAAGVQAETHDEDSTTSGESRYSDRDGQELQPHDWVLLPGTDPVPHYNRGRTRITPYGRRTASA